MEATDQRQPGSAPSRDFETLSLREQEALLLASGPPPSSGILRRLLLWGALPLGALLLSFSVGRYPIPLGELVRTLGALLTGDSIPSALETILFRIRLPRILAALLVGASLGASGAALQGLFRNPLASPGLLGAVAGAGFGASLGICLGLPFLAVQILAFLLGLGAVLLACALGGRMRHNPLLGLVLAGVMTGSLFTAATSLVKYVADPSDKLPAIAFWLMGSLSSVAPRDLLFLFPPVFLGLAPLVLVRWRLNVLSLGEEEARALGLNVGLLRWLVILGTTLATAASISVCGMIGWVGLVVPHLCRMAVGPDFKTLLPASLLGGGVFLLLVDDLARILASVEIPLGILTALVGVPFLYDSLAPPGGGGSKLAPERSSPTEPERPFPS